LTRLITNPEKDFLERLTRLLPRVVVYARMAPKQKEWVINAIKSQGYCTLMCGDGTNDVGALKHAHVGVAILSHCPEWVEKRQKLLQEISQKQHQVNGADPNVIPPPILPPIRAPVGPAGRANRRGPIPPQARPGGRPETNFEKQLAKMMKELDEEEKGQLVKLGDASIAAPFSSKMSSIECSKTRPLFLYIRVLLFLNIFYRSLPRHQTREMYFSYDASNVQNSGLECPRSSLQSIRFIFGWNQVE
jgi:cation-transporting ATPase 13A1